MILSEKESVEASNFLPELKSITVSVPDFSPNSAYIGTGTLKRSQSGELEFEIRSIKNNEFDAFAMIQRTSIVPGTLMPDSLLGKIEAVDTNGEIWRAENVYIDKVESLPSYESITCHAARAVREKTKPSSHHSKIIYLPQHLPIHQRIRSTQDSELDELAYFRTDFKDIEICISSSTEQSIILINSDREIPQNFAEVLLEIVSISTGKLCHPEIVHHISSNTITTEIFSKPANNINIEAMIETRAPWNSIDLIGLINAYLEKYCESYQDLFSTWHRVALSADAGIEVKGLIVCTAIEGLINARYISPIPLSAEIYDSYQKALQLLSKSDIVEEAFRNIKSGIEMLQKPNKGPSAALKEFVRTRGLPESYFKTWSRLRNKLAHFDIIKYETIESQQALFDDYHICLDIYFSLVADVIGYTGSIRRYARQNKK